jgi:acyl-CoA thioesterase-1
VVLGDSITAGYGLEDPALETYPALLSQKILQAGWSYQVVNAGVSGDTTAGGLGRIQWVMKDGADVLIVALGGNDGLRGTAPSATASNLSGIIREARRHQPDVSVILAGMKMPDSMGADFVRTYTAVFAEVATREKASLIPYFLEGVGGLPRLNQPDRIHPTAEGQRIIAETVWKMLRPVLEARQKQLLQKKSPAQDG